MDMLEYFRTAMWIVAIATAMVTLGLGVILAYDWSRYSNDPGSTRISLGVYGLVSVLLLFALMTVIPA